MFFLSTSGTQEIDKYNSILPRLETFFPTWTRLERRKGELRLKSMLITGLGQNLVGIGSQVVNTKVD